MRILKKATAKYHQTGAALLLFFMIIILTGLTFILAVLPDNLKLKQQNQTTFALAKAKQALISYAIGLNYRSNLTTGLASSGWHGYLPCPETTSGSEGSQDSNCNAIGVSALGRLPWQTLSLDPLKDSSGQCLWYAVSAAFKFGPKQLHNADSLGMFDIYDTQQNKLNSDLPEDRIVAIVFAPGKELTGQNRGNQNPVYPCGYPNDQVEALNYLDIIDAINNSEISASINQVESFAGLNTTQELTTFNDRIITITRSEIFNAINSRTKNSQVSSAIRVNALNEQLQDLGSALAQCLIDYAGNTSNRFPWPARIDLSNNSTSDDYSNNNNYTAQFNSANGYLGRLPVIINNADPLLMNHCTSPLSQSRRRLWNDWKDHFFLVIGADYTSESSASTPSCTSTSCPTLGGVEYAALIIFANTAITDSTLTQLRRDSDIEPLTQLSTDLKDSIANYLEGVNATNYGSNSLGSYNLTVGNDIFIGIDINMNITCFNLNTQTVDSACPTLYQN